MKNVYMADNLCILYNKNINFVLLKPVRMVFVCIRMLLVCIRMLALCIYMSVVCYSYVARSTHAVF